MFGCPDCKQKLSHVVEGKKHLWVCPQEHGRAVTLAVLRQSIAGEFLQDMWNKVYSGSFPRDKPCPSCQQLMYQVQTLSDNPVIYLDVCKSCSLVWLEYGELEALPPKHEEPKPVLSLEARHAIAMAKVTAISEAAKLKKEKQKAPDDPWKAIPAVFKLPVEFETRQLLRKPVVTQSLLLLTIVVSCIAFSNKEIFKTLAFIPADFSVINAITAFFVHGGWVHLAGNLYFFAVFGDDVEDLLGRTKYAALLICATFLGSVLHKVTHWDSLIPTVGASDGISGILAFYTLAFPKARLSFLFHFGWIKIPAWVFFLLWIITQFSGILGGSRGVAYEAHISGAIVGLIFWAFTRRSIS